MRDQDSLGLLDVISILSFVIALINLDENMTQSDKQDLQKDLADKADRLLSEIHSHLETQDKQLKEIIERLEMIQNGNDRRDE